MVWMFGRSQGVGRGACVCGADVLVFRVVRSPWRRQSSEPIEVARTWPLLRLILEQKMKGRDETSAVRSCVANFFK